MCIERSVSALAKKGHLLLFWTTCVFIPRAELWQRVVRIKLSPPGQFCFIFCEVIWVSWVHLFSWLTVQSCSWQRLPFFFSHSCGFPKTSRRDKALGRGKCEERNFKGGNSLSQHKFVWPLWQRSGLVPWRNCPDRSQQCKASVYKGASSRQCLLEPLPCW